MFAVFLVDGAFLLSAPCHCELLFKKAHLSVS